MKFLKKGYVYNEYCPCLIKKELENNYSFDGRVDFTFTPNFRYDKDNKVTIDHFISNIEPNQISIDDELKEIKTTELVSVSYFQLKKDYSLQDFFNEHKDAKCIVFYCHDSTTIFHAGYIIRAYIDK